MAAAAAGVQVGAAIVASRYAVAEVPPFTLAMLRYAIGFCCLLPFAWREWHAAPPSQPVHSRARDLASMAALGIGQFGVLIALLNLGLRELGAAEAALIFSLFPLLTLMVSAAMGRERVTIFLLAGVVLSIAGVALSLGPRIDAAHAAPWWSEAAVAGAAAIGAICSVLYRPYLQRYATVPVATFAMLASVVFLAVAAWPEHWPTRVGSFSAGAWGAIVFIGISSGVGYFCWLFALRHEAPTRVTVFLALNPVTAAILGWALLGEPLHPAGIAALGLIAAGLWLATRRAESAR